jgi:uncharacterized protein (DUF302 family)
MRRFAISFCLAFVTTLAQAESGVVSRQYAARFEETREAVTMAIEGRGLVINYVSHIGDMLDRTGADIGAKRKVFAKAEIIEFCSAGLSRQMMEADPHNIVFCPFALSIYTLPGNENTTWVSYRRPTGSAANLVQPLLQAIVDEAKP